MTDDRNSITNDDNRNWITDGASTNVSKMEKYLVPLSGHKDDVSSVTSDKVTKVKTCVYDDKYSTNSVPVLRLTWKVGSTRSLSLHCITVETT